MLNAIVIVRRPICGTMTVEKLPSVHGQLFTACYFLRYTTKQSSICPPVPDNSLCGVKSWSRLHYLSSSPSSRSRNAHRSAGASRDPCCSGSDCEPANLEGMPVHRDHHKSVSMSSPSQQHIQASGLYRCTALPLVIWKKTHKCSGTANPWENHMFSQTSRLFSIKFEYFFAGFNLQGFHT